jgi:hypothetical protein
MICLNENRRGSVLIYGLMLGLVIIVLALALAPSVVQFSSDARNGTNYDGINSGLDCSNSSISSFDKATCYVVDLNIFYFIAGLIFIGGAFVTSKIIFS